LKSRQRKRRAVFDRLNPDFGAVAAPRPFQLNEAARKSFLKDPSASEIAFDWPETTVTGACDAIAPWVETSILPFLRATVATKAALCGAFGSAFK